MAGALGCGCPVRRSHGGVETPEPWLNGAARDPDAADLMRGLRPYRRAMVLLGAAGLVAALAL